MCIRYPCQPFDVSSIEDTHKYLMGKKNVVLIPGFFKQKFIALVQFLCFSRSLAKKYVFMNNPKCSVRPKLIHLNLEALCHYSFIISINRRGESCNFLINENMLKSIATARSEWKARYEHKASYSTDYIVLNLIDFFGNDWKVIKTPIEKRNIHNFKKYFTNQKLVCC